MTALALARAAESLCGCPFRLHGRDPNTGLDCIGVLAVALQLVGREVRFPSGYLLRTERFSGLVDLAAAHGFVVATGPSQPGDVLLVRPGPAQMHLLVAATRINRFVEAHAGLGRVVCRPGPITLPILQRWRLAREPNAQEP